MYIYHTYLNIHSCYTLLHICTAYPDGKSPISRLGQETLRHAASHGLGASQGLESSPVKPSEPGNQNRFFLPNKMWNLLWVFNRCKPSNMIYINGNVDFRQKSWGFKTKKNGEISRWKVWHFRIEYWKWGFDLQWEWQHFTAEVWI